MNSGVNGSSHTLLTSWLSAITENALYLLTVAGLDRHAILELLRGLVTNLFVQRDDDSFPLPYMILADGGFHKRTCFIAPDLPANNRIENIFNTNISQARCVVENAFGLW